MSIDPSTHQPPFIVRVVPNADNSIRHLRIPSTRLVTSLGPFHGARLVNTTTCPPLPQLTSPIVLPILRTHWVRNHGRRPPTQTRAVHSSKCRTKERCRSSQRRRQQLLLPARYLPRPNLRPDCFQRTKLFRDEEKSFLGAGKTELDQS